MASGPGWVKAESRYYTDPAEQRRQTWHGRGRGRPVRKRTRLEKLVLDTLGIEELRDYIGELRDEIARVEADIGRKNSHKSAADAFFRKPG
jgi:uncharacterized small protein (DUF1192 family)